jgi:hypothetical protein
VLGVELGVFAPLESLDPPVEVPFFEVPLEELELLLEDVSGVVAVVDVVVVGVVVAPVLLPGAATLITRSGATDCLEAPDRPIRTPTPIERSSTPTPAITAVALPAREYVEPGRTFVPAV